jgi:hypothetical protein
MKRPDQPTLILAGLALFYAFEAWWQYDWRNPTNSQTWAYASALMLLGLILWKKGRPAQAGG